jgi:hypothetical protein
MYGEKEYHPANSEWLKAKPRRDFFINKARIIPASEWKNLVNFNNN